MEITQTKWQFKSMSKPDETRIFEKGRIDLVTVSGVTFARARLEPGWKWSSHVKPIAKTESCEVPHLQYLVSGRLHVVMDSGDERDFGEGDVFYLPSGHDAWVVGDEPAVLIDITGMGNYAKAK
jgi:quercetin dioxygenase-like cupin family protein